MKDDDLDHGTPPLLEGYPADNPVLGGLAMILGGGDPEEAMFQRDLALDTPGAFCRAAWEALGWLAWPHPITQGLIDQLAAVAATMPTQAQRDRWGAPLDADKESAWQQAREQTRGGDA